MRVTAISTICIHFVLLYNFVRSYHPKKASLPKKSIMPVAPLLLKTSVISGFIKENSVFTFTFNKAAGSITVNVYQLQGYGTPKLVEAVTRSSSSNIVSLKMSETKTFTATGSYFPLGFYYLKVGAIQSPVFAVSPTRKPLIKWEGDTATLTSAKSYRLKWTYSLQLTKAECSWTINADKAQRMSFPCQPDQYITIDTEKSGDYAFEVSLLAGGEKSIRKYSRRWLVDHTPPVTKPVGARPPYVSAPIVDQYFYCSDDKSGPIIPCVSRCSFRYVVKQGGKTLLSTDNAAGALVEVAATANEKVEYEITACAMDALENRATGSDCAVYRFRNSRTAPQMKFSTKEESRATVACGAAVVPKPPQVEAADGVSLSLLNYADGAPTHPCALLRRWTATDVAGNRASGTQVYRLLQFQAATEQQTNTLKCDSGRALNQVKVLKPKISTYQCAKAVAYTTTFTDVKTTDVCDDTYVRYFFLQNTCDQRSLIRNELQIGPYDWKPTPQNTTDPLRRKKRSAPAKGAVTTASPNDLPFIVQFKVQFILSTGPSESQYFQDLTNTSAKDYQYYQTQICNYLTSCIHHTNKASSFAKATSIHCHIVQFFNGSLISRTYMGFNPTEVGSSPAESDLEKALNAGSMAFHKAAQSTPNGLPYIGARPGGPFAINPPPVAQMQYETFPTFLFLVLITMIVCVGIALLAALIICCDVICASNNAQQKVAPQPAPPA